MAMLFPTKHEHPDQTVMALASIMIKHMRRYEVVTYDALRVHCQKRGRKVEYLFTPALDLLYVLGLVEYLPKIDAFQWTRKVQP